MYNFLAKIGGEFVRGATLDVTMNVVGKRQAERRRAVREAADSYGALRAAETQLAALQPAVGAEAAAALRAAETAYAEGAITLVEWLDAVRAYQEAEASYAALQAEAIVRRAALERATGVALLP